MSQAALASLEPTSSSPDKSALRALWENLPAEVRNHYLNAAEGRLDSIKNYQLSIPALTAFKESAINGTGMGGGKTLMAIFHAFLIRARYVAVILPRKAFDTWKLEIARVNLECLTINGSADARALRKRIYDEKQRGEYPREPVFCLISKEWLCLGGLANTPFDPWTAFLKLDAAASAAVLWLYGRINRNEGEPDKLALISRLGAARTTKFFEELTREKAGECLEAAAARDLANARDQNPAVTPEEATTPLRNALSTLFDLALEDNERRRKAYDANEAIPTRQYDWRMIAGRNTNENDDTEEDDSKARVYHAKLGVVCEQYTSENEAIALRKRGVGIRKGQSYLYQAHVLACPSCSAVAPEWTGLSCKNPKCRHVPRCYRSEPRSTTHINRDAKQREEFRGQEVSCRSYPGYKLLPKFSLKMVDEFHEGVSLTTIHGTAMFDVEARDTLLLSGTIVRTHLTELEPSLAMVHDQNSPEFPYSRFAFSDFRERFNTEEVTMRSIGTRRVLLNRRRVPEASNLSYLRKLLASRHAAVDQDVIDREWNLPRPPERAVNYTIPSDLWSQYQGVLQNVLGWREALVARMGTQIAHERQSASNELMRGARSRVDLLSSVLNTAKVPVILDWVRNELLAQNRRGVVVVRSVPLFKALVKALTKAGIPFRAVDESVSAEERHDVLTEFAESGCPLCVSRLKLINSVYNQLVCCTRLLLAQVEASPALNRQMIRRLSRPGQTSNDVRVDYLIGLLPTRVASVDEIEINRFLRRERAIKEVTGNRPRFRVASMIYEAATESRGAVQVLEDLASSIASEYVPKPIELPQMAAVDESREAEPATATNTPVRESPAATPGELPMDGLLGTTTAPTYTSLELFALDYAEAIRPVRKKASSRQHPPAPTAPAPRARALAQETFGF